MKKNYILVSCFLTGFILLEGCKSSVVTTTVTSYTVQVTPGAASSLTRVTSDPNVRETFPTVSPDGKMMLYNANDPSKSTSTEQNQVFMKEVSPQVKPAVTPLRSGAMNAIFHPNGSDIIYTTFNDHNYKTQLVKTSLKRGGITYITGNAAGYGDDEACYIGDGSRIVFSTYLEQEAVTTTTTVKTTGVNLKALVEDATYAIEKGTSPTMLTGSYYYNYSNTNSNTTSRPLFDICTVEANGTNFTIHTRGCSPSYSPDGKKIVYTNTENDKFAHIYVLDIESGQSSQLTSGSYYNRNPRFSPDGKYIVFSSTKDTNPTDIRWNIFYLSTDGLGLTRLTQGDAHNDGAFWSVDNYIYFHSKAASKKANLSDKVEDIWRFRPNVQLENMPPSTTTSINDAKIVNQPPPTTTQSNNGQQTTTNSTVVTNGNTPVNNSSTTTNTPNNTVINLDAAQGAVNAYLARDYAQAIKLFESYIAGNPTDIAKAYALKGLSYYKQGNTTNAYIELNNSEIYAKK